MTAGKRLLVTGGAGFIGCNLADRLALEGHDVLVFDSLVRPGVAENLEWLRRRHPRRIGALIADVRDCAAVAEAVGEAAGVFHLAAQVAVTTSLDDPMADFAVNVQGTLHLLDALRRRREKPPLVFASTNKVYGDLADIGLALIEGRWQPVDPKLRARGVAENRPIEFHTPYGCSKGAADQYVLDFARSFGVPTAVLRMSCIFGPHQQGTEDQGWVAHFLYRALAGETVTVFGDGRQVRDVLFVDDAVSAYLAAWRRIGVAAGRPFNLGGGIGNEISLLDLIARLERITGRRLDVSWAEWRQGDQRWFVADSSRARTELGLPSPLPWQAGLARLAEWAGARSPASFESAA